MLRYSATDKQGRSKCYANATLRYTCYTKLPLKHPLASLYPS